MDEGPLGGARPAEFWKPLAGGDISCLLCPHRCRIGPGKKGICRVRVNEGGRLVLPFYGAISGAGMDPVEKKPLYHFLPGTQVFSLGFVGCNLHCPFCQNWDISQSTESVAKRMEAEDVIKAARRSGSPSIAYTYSEPSVHYEFVLDCMRLARESGIRNILVTNGCLQAGPAAELLAMTDAANVDLKCWSAERYRKELGGDLDAVLGFIREASARCHLEVTTLVVPDLSDGSEDVAAIAAFLADLDPDIPLHLSAYHPAWRHRAPATDPDALLELALVARRFLRYVYVGNLSGIESDTRCAGCGALLVRRRGYAVSVPGLGPAAIEVARGGPGRAARAAGAAAPSSSDPPKAPWGPRPVIEQNHSFFSPKAH
ncbi:MAG TPA: AmmeMemoRadiSam system radical SAM enzyme [Rectinemataceae bacterium]|nr:AmmeMemoRadiSam system radical SAM enzyme [Rectinemataceae bacterium]